MLLFQRPVLPGATSGPVLASWLAPLVLLLLLVQTLQVQARVTSFVPSSQLDEKPLRAQVIELTTEQQVSQVNAAAAASVARTPVLFWHGMGDTAAGSINIDRLALEKRLPGVRVFSVQIGSSSVEDAMASYFSNVNKQIEQVCDELLHNDQVRQAGALNAVGFSQGGQFLRGLIERCPLRAHGIRVKNLITLGGQHQGVFGLPSCNSNTFCDYIRHMLSMGAYRDYVQQHLVQAEYWHDPLNENEYKKRNIFLADINNELQINETYRANLAALDHLVLVQFLQDEMVVPRESSHFGFYVPGQNKRTRPLEQSPMYQEDRLGLKQLAQGGRLQMISVPGRHLQYKMDWFLDQIADKYLDN